MNLTKRISNLWFWSTISPEDVKDNPHSFVAQALNKQNMQGGAYFAGLSDEEESFANSLNVNGKDTILS